MAEATPSSTTTLPSPCPACRQLGAYDCATRMFRCRRCDLTAEIAAYRRLLALLEAAYRLDVLEGALATTIRSRLELRRIVEVERLYAEGIVEAFR